MNDSPRFLRVEGGEALHAMSLKLSGGRSGLRDRNAFESAVNQPQSLYFYDQCDLFDIAAVYGFHMAQAQAFVDGNKRTGAASAIIFLEANGYPIEGDSMLNYNGLVGIAKGEMDRTDWAEIFREIT